MKHLVFVVSLTIFCTSFAKARKRHCDVLIDPEYKGYIQVYAKPNGKLTKNLRQDFKNEDYLIFTIRDQNSEYFYGTLTYSISEKHVNGWIRKANYIGVYGRNYAPGDKLKLYTNANLKSPVKCIIPEGTNQIYQVIRYNNDWVYIKTNYKGRVKEGWLSPDMQCSNPYTTCN